MLAALVGTGGLAQQRVLSTLEQPFIGVHRLFEAIAIGLRFARAIEIELTSGG